MGFYIRVNCPISIVNIIISDPNSWIWLRLAHPVVKQLEYQPPNTIGPCDKYTKTTAFFGSAQRINFKHPWSLTWHLKIKFLENEGSYWKASFSGAMFNFCWSFRKRHLSCSRVHCQYYPHVWLTRLKRFQRSCCIFDTAGSPCWRNSTKTNKKAHFLLCLSMEKKQHGTKKTHRVWWVSGISVWFLFGYLVGGFNPFEKYARQIGSFPQKIGVKIQKIFETTT